MELAPAFHSAKGYEANSRLAPVVGSAWQYL